MEKENTKNITSIGWIPDFKNVLKVDFEYVEQPIFRKIINIFLELQ